VHLHPHLGCNRCNARSGVYLNNWDARGLLGIGVSQRDPSSWIEDEFTYRHARCIFRLGMRACRLRRESLGLITRHFPHSSRKSKARRRARMRTALRASALSSRFLHNDAINGDYALRKRWSLAKDREGSTDRPAFCRFFWIWSQGYGSHAS
jgi:hypothetical protein